MTAQNVHKGSHPIRQLVDIKDITWTQLRDDKGINNSSECVLFYCILIQQLELGKTLLAITSTLRECNPIKHQSSNYPSI